MTLARRKRIFSKQSNETSDTLQIWKVTRKFSRVALCSRPKHALLKANLCRHVRARLHTYILGESSQISANLHCIHAITAWLRLTGAVSLHTNVGRKTDGETQRNVCSCRRFFSLSPGVHFLLYTLFKFWTPLSCAYPLVMPR